MECPKCHKRDRQVKSGLTEFGSQRHKCQHCGTRYTPEPKSQGYSRDIRMAAMRMYVDGLNFRRIGRHLGVNPQSVANWVKAYAAQLPSAAKPSQVDILEMDELHTFVGHKKTKPTS